MLRQYFTGSVIFAAVAIALAGVIGYLYGGPSVAVAMIISAALLGVLETCVSFDNAVVNATVLRDMDAVWRRRFLTWGIVIAVFGVRLVLPIIIVSIAASVAPWHALNIALFQPEEYTAAITSAHGELMGFGGSFLLMVFLKFFLDAEKDIHWVGWIERHITSAGKIESVQVAIAITLLLCLSPLMDEPSAFFTAGLIGVIVYILVDGLGALLGGENAGATAAKSGLAGFMYLEVVDASFSLDGVLAAFAVTNNFLVIALGLGIGAMFVRSMTVYMVERGTLEQFTFLEHGAFWAIGFLVAIMFLSGAGIHLGELVAAGGSLAIIGASLIHSVYHKKRQHLT